jgi:predicted DNA-binding protein
MTTTPSSTGSSCARNKNVRIRVSKETADHLKLLARDGEEGWSDIIRRLITTYYEEDKNSILREAKRFYLTND